MNVKGITPILNVASVCDAIIWFERLGWQRGFTWNPAGMIADDALEDANGPATFASVCAGDDDEYGSVIFLCQGAQGARDPDTPEPPTVRTSEPYG